MRVITIVGLIVASDLMLTLASAREQKADLYVQTGHAHVVNSVVLSPDGKLVASGGADGTLKLWDAATGQELRTLKGHGAAVNAVSFSPDGKTLASGSDDKTVRLWDTVTGRELRTLSEHAVVVNSVAFSRDGKTLAAGGGSRLTSGRRWVKPIILWDVETGKILKTFHAHRGSPYGPDNVPFNSIALSPDGKTLASGDITTKLWSTETGQVLQTLSAQSGSVNAVAFSPDGKVVASGYWYKTIKLWDVETGQELRTLEGHAATVNAVAFSSDGKTLASGGDDKTVRLWDAATGRELRRLTSHAEAVKSVAFSPGGNTLASGGGDYSVSFRHGSYKISSWGGGDTIVRLWDAETGRELRTFAGHAAAVNAVALSFDGSTLASSPVDGTIKLWNTKTGQEMRTLAGHTAGVSSIALSRDGKTLAAGTLDGVLKLWDAETGRVLRTIDAHRGGTRMASVNAVAFSPDGELVASGSGDKTVKLWNVETGQELRTLSGHADAVERLAFSPDGKTLASGCDERGDDKTVRLWVVETGQLIKSLDQRDPNALREVRSLVSDYTDFLKQEAITSDGRFHVKGGSDGKLDLYDKKTGRLLASLVALDKTDWAVVTPDGLFDGSPAAWRLLSWRLSDRLYDIVPIEAFFNEFYRPGLLQDLFAGRKIEKPKRDISMIDIRQPEVKIRLSNAAQNAVQVTSRRITVAVEVEDAPADGKRKATSGAQDVRLFRNGSLVKVWRGDVIKGKKGVTLEATIPVIAGENRLIAYAFNRENVKSSDATLVVSGADNLKRAGTVYVLAVGVNRYSNPKYDLKYAVPDAQAFGAEIKRQQEGLGRYARVEIIPLHDREATKSNILRALGELASKVQPEDGVIVYFAGHGTAHRNQFYLLPHDLGYAGARTSLDEEGLRSVLANSISDRQLERAFEKLDAGQLLFIIDACNSGQALEAEEKRRGPMNSKGLAQLAYEKGMYILTAAQSFQAAQEASQLGHGLLTYALVEEGLKQAAADSEPKDGTILVREWLDYATARVPEMQIDKMKKARDAGVNLSFAEEERGLDMPRRSGQVPRVFYRRELDVRPLIVAKPGPKS